MYITLIGNIIDDNKIVNRQQEVKARRWGYENTVKIPDLIKAYEYGAVNRFEIAQYLEVTEEHLINAISNYKKRYGYFVETENNYLFFEPYFEVKKKDDLFDYLLN